MDTGHPQEEGPVHRTGRIKRRLTFSTPVAGIACDSNDAQDTPRASGGTRRRCKNARINSSPFSFGVRPRDTTVTGTPTMKMVSQVPSRNRFSLRPKRVTRQASTPQCAFRFGSMQFGSQISGPDNMHQSPAVLCTEMIPARHEVAEARTATTASVYETLFGCPPQFATVADVIPESQAISQGHVHTPREEQNMQATPSSLLAFSAMTTKSEVPMSHELEQDMQGARPVSDQQATGSLAAFGSPAETGETPEVGAPASGVDMTSAEARAMNAQAGGFSAFASVFPSLSQLRSPWREPSNRSSSMSATTADEFLFEDKALQGMQGAHSQFQPARSHSGAVNLMPLQRPTAFGSTFGGISAQFPESTSDGRAEVNDLIPAAYGPFDAAGPLVGGAPLSDSDSEQDDDDGCSEMSQDSDCDDNETGYSNFSIDLLAATLGNRFETLLLSPDNQVPLLHNSLGRKVSAHGGVVELNAEPWGRKAVFGSRSTGRASGSSRPGSAHLHGPGTIALKLARSERRTEQATPDEVEDVSTPLTVCSSKEDVLFTIGAPIDSKQKPSRLLATSPAQCTAKLGVRMLEPAPVPQAMMTSSADNSRCNTVASSPEPSGVPPILLYSKIHRGFWSVPLPVVDAVSECGIRSARCLNSAPKLLSEVVVTFWCAENMITCAVEVPMQQWTERVGPLGGKQNAWTAVVSSTRTIRCKHAEICGQILSKTLRCCHTPASHDMGIFQRHPDDLAVVQEVGKVLSAQ